MSEQEIELLLRKRLLTPLETACVLGCGKRRVYTMIENGEIETIASRPIRIVTKSVLQLLPESLRAR